MAPAFSQLERVISRMSERPQLVLSATLAAQRAAWQLERMVRSLSTCLSASRKPAGKGEGVGDVDNDGYDDIVVGAWLAGSAYVYSGQTGDLLYTFTGSNHLGLVVGAAGDVNGDGFHDVIATAYGSDFPGHVTVYSGANGTMLYELQGVIPGEWFGIGVAGVGDLDGNGAADLVVGASSNDNGATNGGEVYAFLMPRPPCFWDLDDSGDVGVTDFLALLAAWGPCDDCDDCPADFDGDCVVGITDFLILVANWG